jgi:large subunit ribosomal protein L30
MDKFLRQMKKLRIKQVKSRIGRTLRQKRTLDALGLTKLNQEREVEASPQVLGMIHKVKHLLIVEEVK